MNASRLAAALVAFAVLCGCGGHGSTTGSASPAPTGVASAAAPVPSPTATPGRVGYVRMGELVEHSALYPQLRALDRQIMSLQMQLEDPDNPAYLATIARTQRDLNAQLAAAAKQAQALLRAHGADLEREQQTAIDHLLARAHGGAAPSMPASRGTGDLHAAAAQGAAAYGSGLATQQAQAVRAIETNLNARDQRLFRERLDALQQQEAAAALDLARQDAPERISLRAKSTDLALAPQQRASVNRRLADLDEKERAAASQREARDTAALDAYRVQLHTKSQKEFDLEVARLRGAGGAQLKERDRVAGAQRADGVNLPPVPAAAPLDPALHAQIQSLHRRFQARFDEESKESVADFGRTRAQLQEKFNQFARAHADAQNALQAQITRLQAQRQELYARIAEQIRRTVSARAAQNHVPVVFSDTLAVNGIVDLTSAAENTGAHPGK